LKDNNEKKENTAPHIICSGCYRFNEFKQKCSFYWGGKKECGSKVKDYDDMIMLDHLRRR
jgi:hypothetical protein